MRGNSRRRLGGIAGIGRACLRRRPLLPSRPCRRAGLSTPTRSSARTSSCGRLPREWPTLRARLQRALRASAAASAAGKHPRRRLCRTRPRASWPQAADPPRSAPRRAGRGRTGGSTTREPRRRRRLRQYCAATHAVQHVSSERQGRWERRPGGGRGPGLRACWLNERAHELFARAHRCASTERRRWATLRSIQRPRLCLSSDQTTARMSRRRPHQGAGAAWRWPAVSSASVLRGGRHLAMGSDPP